MALIPDLGKNAKISPAIMRNSMESRGSPSIIKVRNEGLKVDLVMLDGKVSGFTLEYQDIKDSRELKKWIDIVDQMTFRPASATKDAVPSFPVSAPDSPAPPSLPIEEPQEKLIEQPKELIEEPQEKLIEQPKELIEEPQEKLIEKLPEIGDYREIVLRAVDKSLDIIGKDGKDVLLSLLESRYGLLEEEIPEHPRAFIDLLEEGLGSSAYAVEKEIMREIRKVSSVQAENLYKVVELLKEEYPAKAPVQSPAASTTPIGEDAGPALLASEEEDEKPAEEVRQEPQLLEDPPPAGFNSSMNDPIPVGFKYSASFSSHGLKAKA